MQVVPETVTSKDPPSVGSGIDPLNQPMPGESLAAPPGQFAHDNPPNETSPEVVLEEIKNYLMKPEVTDELVAQMAAGFPVEAIVGMFVKGGVAQGKFSPDLAEIIKPPLTVILIGMALDAGITDLVTFTDEPIDQIAEQEGIEDRMRTTMKHLRPELASEMRAGESRERMAGMADERKTRIAAKQKISNLSRETEVPSDGSFLEMGEV